MGGGSCLEIVNKAQTQTAEGKHAQINPEDVAFCEDFVISEIVRWGL
jgi:hypothetical protein